jgi:hypothetical protein
MMKEQINVTTIELTEEELEAMRGGCGDDCGWRENDCDDDDRCDWRDDCGDNWHRDDCDRVYRRGCRW